MTWFFNLSLKLPCCTGDGRDPHLRWLCTADCGTANALADLRVRLPEMQEAVDS